MTCIGCATRTPYGAAALSFIVPKKGISEDLYLVIRTSDRYFANSASDKYTLTYTVVESSGFGSDIERSLDDYIKVNNVGTAGTHLKQCKIPGTVSGTMDNELDVDWYRVNVTEGASVVFSISDNTAVSMALFNSSIMPITGASGSNFTQNTMAEGTYYVGVYPATGQWSPGMGKTYTLEVRAIEPYFAQQWSLHDAYGIDIEAAWELAPKRGEGITVGILDDMLDLKHEDFKGQISSLNGYNTGVIPPSDHGTHVAGIVAAATDNGLGIAGIAPNAKIMALDMNSSTSGAIEYARSKGVKVGI